MRQVVTQHRSRKRNYPHGTAIEPSQIKHDIFVPNTATSSLRNASANNHGSIEMSDLFVTMCFFARLGFVQPTSCLKCAYLSSRCSSTDKENCNNGNSGMDFAEDSKKSCAELVAWRIDANIALHPENLEGNIVFVTCDTAKSLVNGDAYPSIRWDIKNKRLLHEKFDLDTSKVDRSC